MTSTSSPSESAKEDAEWVRVILEGKSGPQGEECYAKLLRKYWKLVNVLAASKVGDRREAEDIAQEAFVRAFRSLSKLTQPVAFLGWLLQITRNLITDHIRSRKSIVSLNLVREATESTSPGTREQRSGTPPFEEEIETAEEIGQVLTALQELPEKYREVIALKYLQGLDGKTMAGLLGEPEGTVRNRLFRAIDKLRESLGHRKAKKP